MTPILPANGAVVPIPYSTQQLNPIDEAIMRAALAGEDNRQRDYNRALAAYNGNFPKPFKTAPGQPDDNVIVNVIAPIIDVGVHFLFGTPPEVTLPLPGDGDGDDDDDDDTADGADNNGGDGVDATTPTGTDPLAPPQLQPAKPEKPQPPKLTPEQQLVEDAQEWLDECLRVNNFPLFCLDLAANGGLGGTPYGRIYTTSMYPNKEDKDRPYPRIQVLDPACMAIQSDPRDIDRVMAYIWTYNAGSDPRTGKPRFERQIVRRVILEFIPQEGVEPEQVEQWEVIDQHSESKDDNYITDNRTPWPYPWSPIMHCKNLPNPNSVYGRPDITPTMITANRQLNFSLSNAQRIERFYGHKRIWIKGMAGQEVGWLDTGTAVIIDIPNPEAAVGEIAPSNDGGQAANRRMELYGHILEEASTPSIVLGRTDPGASRPDPSGVSLKVRLIPMTARLETKKKTYGPFLITLINHLLELGGYGDDLLPVLEWKEQLPVDPIEERNALKMDHDMGIASLETIAEKLDYDWDSEKAKIDKEEQSNMQSKMLQAQAIMARRATVMPPGAQPAQNGAPTQNVNGAQVNLPGQQGQGSGQPPAQATPVSPMMNGGMGK